MKQYDQDFLVRLNRIRNKTTYARIIALTNDGAPIEQIEGRIISGTINIDGSSAVRRTCSLQMAPDNINYNNYIWTFKTRFQLEIGVENKIDSRYPNIIWFNQGIYVLTSFNTSHSTNNFTINLQGKDKMCLLNGEVSGSLESEVDFGAVEEETENSEWVIKKIPIYQIIRNMIHLYGKEPYHNIIIKDLEALGLELLEYRNENPMYLYREAKENSIYNNILFDGTTKCIVNGETKELQSLTVANGELEQLTNTLFNESTEQNLAKIKFEGNDIEYYITKIEYGQTAGYRATELVYAGDLIAKVGESLTSILDKIKNMLGEFEYFYNIDGQFIFQKKPHFIETIWGPSSNDSENKYIDNLLISSPISYSFTQSDLITAFNNTPNIMNLKNDFAIWGTRTSLTGQQLPVHMRYAIDNKPTQYRNYENTITYQVSDSYEDLIDLVKCDWREIIYQMALDHLKYNHRDDFEIQIANLNPQYIYGRTNYEQYYTDILGFWRQLYYPNKQDYVKEILNQAFKNNQPANEEDIIKQYEELYYGEDNQAKKGWLKAVYEAPETLNFWLDFLDTRGQLSQFSVKNIGARVKSINDSNVKSIYFRDTPNVIFVSSVEQSQPESGYRYIQIPNIEAMFSISTQGKSAKDKLDELIYQHGCCSESISITTIPIYYLEPNTRILVNDEKTGIEGEYILNRFSLSLAYNGTMSLTAIKAVENIL